MTSPWWAAFGPAEMRVSCGGGQHVLRWAGGSLQAADHQDEEAELVIAAPGGAPTPCVDLVRVWRRHCDDLSVLAVGPRSADDQLTIGAEAIDELVSPGRQLPTRPQRPPARRLIGPPAPPAAPGPPAAPTVAAGGVSPLVTVIKRPARQVSAGIRVTPPLAHFFAERAEVLALMALGAPFQFRLSATVACAWCKGGQHQDELAAAAPALTAALAGRFGPAAAQWLGIDPADIEAAIHQGTGWGDVELTNSAGKQALHARLPACWLARIWAPGLAVVAGHLIVSVLRADWPTAQVLALERPGGSPVELSVQHAEGRWSVGRSRSFP
jgi:hypothetical protein